MYVNQAIQSPVGVTTFGSAIIRVTPDIASFTFSVSRTTKDPKQSFNDARNAANQVRDYLSKALIKESASSRMTLTQSWRWVNNENQFIGFTAKVDFNLVVTNLDQLEQLTTGLVQAGVNQIQDVKFQTSRLKELRAEARKSAVAAAREKAELYCEAAGAKLGAVRHIEDVNPDQLTASGNHHHSDREVQPADEETFHAVDPGSIIVAAGVMLVFALDL